MRARAPLDIDLEDKLVYGLTPMRLAYLVVSLVGAFALWSLPSTPPAVRAAGSLLVIAVGAALAWGRWRGRSLDAWVMDFAVFVVNTRRVTWNSDWVRHTNPEPIRSPSTHTHVSPTAIVVIGRAPKAGASTVAFEMAACLATGRDGTLLWSVSAAPAGHDHRPSPSGFLLSVAAVDAGRVCYLDRGAGPFVAGLIPEDEHVPRAAALNLATVIAFPDAPASRAFRELAEVVAAAG